MDPFDSGAFGAGGRVAAGFPPVELPVGFGQTRKPTQLPVLTMICAYSRWLSALLIPSRCAADLFAGWWRLIAGLGAVPRALVWDGEGAIGRWRAGRAELQRVSGVSAGCWRPRSSSAGRLTRKPGASSNARTTTNRHQETPFNVT